MAGKPCIAIVGGSLGGTLAGLLLQRAGHPVTIYEQAPALPRSEAGLDLRAHAMRIVRHVGLEARLQRVGFVPLTGASRIWDSGEVVFSRPYARWARLYGASDLIVRRGELLATLASALRPGTLAFGKRLDGVEAGPGGRAGLRFADGARVSADIVIGADGRNSRLREILLGPAPPARAARVGYRAVVPAARLEGLQPSFDTTDWWSDDRHPDPEGRHVVVRYLTAARDLIELTATASAPDGEGGTSHGPAPARELRECCAGFHPEVLRTVEACPGATRSPLAEADGAPFWSEGSIVLIGSACHPMPPDIDESAAMAMEDAAVLARCLAACEGDAPVAFALFRANRAARIERVRQEGDAAIWRRHEPDPAWLLAHDALTEPLVWPAAPV